MDEIETPIIVTAIGDAEFEGFVSSTLFSQGWSVVLRALDFNSLEKFLSQNLDQKFVLVYSSDLPGITPEGLRRVQTQVVRTFGFESQTSTLEKYPQLIMRPKNAIELISYIRGNIRSPLLRSVIESDSYSRRAKIIAVGSTGHCTGTTTLAINLAFEASLLGKRTLLIDANFRSPSIAILLEERSITQVDSWKSVFENLYLAEATQDNLSDLTIKLASSSSEFDLIVLDLGSLRGLSSLLSDRRWGSQLIAWSCARADTILITSTDDVVARSNLKFMIDDLQQTFVSALVRLVFIGGDTPKRKKSSHLSDLSLSSQTLGARPLLLPSDSHIIVQARIKRVPLEQINARGVLRQAIAAYAKELFS